MRQKLILNIIAIENHSQFSCFVRYRGMGIMGRIGLIRRRGFIGGFGQDYRIGRINKMGRILTQSRRDHRECNRR